MATERVGYACAIESSNYYGKGVDRGGGASAPSPPPPLLLSNEIYILCMGLLKLDEILVVFTLMIVG